MNHWDELIDWREEASDVPVNAGGMGTIESNQKRLAFRMKRRGMKWSKKGAQAVAKVQQSIANNEFHQILSWNLSVETPVTNRVKRMANRVGHRTKRTTGSNKIPTKINVAGAPQSSAIGSLSRIGSIRSLIV
jgi:hypothetical protein